MSEAVYDTIIIGGGPAGAAAAVYAARKKLKALLITRDFGGQSAVSSDIENWIGEEKLTGLELAEKLEKHVRRQHEIEVKIPEKVAAVAMNEGPNCIFEVHTDKGGTYRSKTLMGLRGSEWVKLYLLEHAS